MWTLRFWKDLAERAISTWAQAVIALVGLDLVAGTVVSVGWKQVLLVSAVAGGLSVLKGLTASTVGRDDSASFVPSQPPPGTS